MPDTFAGALASHVFIVRRGGEIFCKAAADFGASGMNGLMARKAAGALTARKADSRGWLGLLPVSRLARTDLFSLSAYGFVTNRQRAFYEPAGSRLSSANPLDCYEYV